MTDKSACLDRPSRLARWRELPRPIVSPSLLACDFARMSDVLALLESLGAGSVHLDVMDGHFVPNLSYGAPVIARWREVSNLCFDTHLMMSDPARYLDDFVAAGCDRVTVHIEAVPHPRELLARIRAAGCHAVLSLNPPTPVDDVLPYVDAIDGVLVMSVMPGFGGQAFQPAVLDKVRALRDAKPGLELAIDGGIKPNTARLAAASGITQLIAGSAVFSRPGHEAEALAELARAARLIEDLRP